MGDGCHFQTGLSETVLSEQLTSRFGWLGAATAGASFSLSLSLYLLLVWTLFLLFSCLRALSSWRSCEKKINVQQPAVIFLCLFLDDCKATLWFAPTKCVDGWKSYRTWVLYVHLEHIVLKKNTNHRHQPHVGFPTATPRLPWPTFNAVRTPTMYLCFSAVSKSVKLDAEERTFRQANPDLSSCYLFITFHVEWQILLIIFSRKLTS